MLALGFRPFYLLGSAFAALSIAFWAAQFAGWLPPGSLYANPLWHAHEMIFGFALAVIVGFLFTAGRNWAGHATPTGAPLAAIVALWLAARLLALTPWSALAAACDVAFALAAAAGLAVPLLRAGNRRNYFFVALLVAMAALNAAFHLALAGTLDIDLRRVLGLALDAVLFVCVVIAGRVIPMFTNNAVPGAGARRNAWVEKAALGSVLALVAGDIAGAPAGLIAAVAAIGTLAHAIRWSLWNPMATRRKPVLWILHAAYAWVPIHLALRALAALGFANASLASHALAVGVIGGLTLGMMTRTSRGHTGRTLEVGRAEITAYALVLAAAGVRVFVPWMAPSWTTLAIAAAGALWSAAFLVFTVTYWPILTRPRVDGLPG
jgi:uncharacterized protein involved in response to NO